MRTFSLKGTLIFFGTKLSGFGDSDALTIDPAGPTWVRTEGVDGTVARAYTGSEAFNLKIKLLQTSPANAIMSGIYNADKGSSGGVVLPFSFKDQNGLDTFIAPEAWIVQLPSVVRGNKISTQEWQIETGEAKLFLGGN